MLSVHSDGLIRANEEFAAWLKGERTQPFGQTQEHTTVRLTGMSRLLWHALGAKTIELIHQNVHVEIIRDDLDEIVLDAELLEVILRAYPKTASHSYNPYREGIAHPKIGVFG